MKTNKKKDIILVEYWTVPVKKDDEKITGITNEVRLNCKSLTFDALMEALRKEEFATRIYPNITTENFNIKKWCEGSMSEYLTIIKKPYTDVDAQEGTWIVDIISVELEELEEKQFIISSYGQPEQLSLFGDL